MDIVSDEGVAMKHVLVHPTYLGALWDIVRDEDSVIVCRIYSTIEFALKIVDFLNTEEEQ